MNYLLWKGEELLIVIFFGGVVDCLNMISMNFFKYGDIGLFLGKYLRKLLIFLEKEVLESVEIIWVMVVGVGLYIVEISGSMIVYCE